MGVQVKRKQLRGVDGYVEVHKDGYHAWLGTGTRACRERFTLAHELGHVVIMRTADRGRPVGLVRYRSGQLVEVHSQDPVEERLCNVFATEFLMPGDEIRMVLQQGRLGPESVWKIATKFAVSLTAAARRVVDMAGSQKIGVALWDLDASWPMPVWWLGLKAKTCRNEKELEAWAVEGRKVPGVSQLRAHGRRLRAEVAPLRPNGRFVLMAVTPIDLEESNSQGWSSKSIGDAAQATTVVSDCPRAALPLAHSSRAWPASSIQRAERKPDNPHAGENESSPRGQGRQLRLFKD
jgi:hypothetical protein